MLVLWDIIIIKHTTGTLAHSLPRTLAHSLPHTLAHSLPRTLAHSLTASCNFMQFRFLLTHLSNILRAFDNVSVTNRNVKQNLVHKDNVLKPLKIWPRYWISLGIIPVFKGLYRHCVIILSKQTNQRQV